MAFREPRADVADRHAELVGERLHDLVDDEAIVRVGPRRQVADAACRLVDGLGGRHAHDGEAGAQGQGAGRDDSSHLIDLPSLRSRDPSREPGSNATKGRPAANPGKPLTFRSADRIRRAVDPDAARRRARHLVERGASAEALATLEAAAENIADTNPEGAARLLVEAVELGLAV